ncbi:PIG-L family deacetylase [Candidatus Saganbacteria bacterium]|nr:PIG-L family deacetylase [Candidatus Saganbacteria bacterium]
MNILIIAPHPDDETLGVGGVIVKNVKKGNKVYCCVLTKAFPPQYSEELIVRKREEAEEARRVLGVEKNYYLELPTLKLDTLPLFDIQQKIMAVISKCHPEVVYLPHHGDINSDHRVAFEAGILAAKFTKESTVRNVLSYEVICSANWAPPFPESAFIPNYFEDISGTLAVKMEALKCYRSEMKLAPHPRSLELIEIEAKRWGSVIGTEAAEAFILIRGRVV